MAFSASAMADVTVDTRGLSNSQKAELVKQVEQMKQTARELPTGSAEKVDQWVNVGEHLGKMLGGAAKEVGIAVNEFVKTPVGMLATGVIVFNYVGGAVIHVTCGLLILFMGWGILWYYSRASTRLIVEYDTDKPANWLGKHPIKKVSRAEIDENTSFALWFSAFVILVVSVITIFSW